MNSEQDRKYIFVCHKQDVFLSLRNTDLKHSTQFHQGFIHNESTDAEL